MSWDPLDSQGLMSYRPWVTTMSWDPLDSQRLISYRNGTWCQAMEPNLPAVP
jgi:hypothetical protein